MASSEEDPTIKAQDVKRCQLCFGKDRKLEAEILCKTCLVNLCKHCVGVHMVSDPNIKHKVLTFESMRCDFTPPPCNIHEKQSCEKFCQLCDFPVCQQCLSSGVHENHSMQQISEIYRSRQEIIEKDKNELANDIAPMYDSTICEIKSMLSNVIRKHGERRQAIIGFGNRCHMLVDKVIERYLNDSKEIERKDIDSLQALKFEFQSRKSSIQSAVNENETILASCDLLKLLQYDSKTEHIRTAPSWFKLTVPQFNPNEPTEQEMRQIFGTILETIKSDFPVTKDEELMTNFVNEPKRIQSTYKTFAVSSV